MSDEELATACAIASWEYRRTLGTTSGWGLPMEKRREMEAQAQRWEAEAERLNVGALASVPDWRSCGANY